MRLPDVPSFGRLDCGGRLLDLSQPCVMGVLNVTPDSFSDGGRFQTLDRAIAHAEALAKAGADLLDVGGESTRPGANPVSAGEECQRVVPVIEALAAKHPLPISVDTSKPEVMRAAVAAGAGFINDVRALSAPGALETAVDLGVPVCLMHMQGTPAHMQQSPRYQDVVAEVRDFLAQRIQRCEAAGLPRERICIDPGFGFGKTLEHNLQLLAHLDQIAQLGCPVLVGISRKSMIGQLTDRPVEDRLAGSLAAAVLALERGARILRTHDPKETQDALRVAWAVRSQDEA